jgi:hypothetical protein
MLGNTNKSKYTGNILCVGRRVGFFSPLSQDKRKWKYSKLFILVIP